MHAPDAGAPKEVPATKHWLAVATNENCSVLAAMNYPFYALNSRPDVAIGDCCVLYRSGKHSGFIGAFRFATAPVDEHVRLADSRTFAIRLPWLPLYITDANPVDVRSLVKELAFITNKTVYSMSLRNSFRRIPEHDYSLIYARLLEHAAPYMINEAGAGTVRP